MGSWHFVVITLYISFQNLVTQLQIPSPTAAHTVKIFWHVCYISYDDSASKILNIKWYIAGGLDEG